MLCLGGVVRTVWLRFVVWHGRAKRVSCTARAAAPTRAFSLLCCSSSRHARGFTRRYRLVRGCLSGLGGAGPEPGVRLLDLEVEGSAESSRSRYQSKDPRRQYIVPPSKYYCSVLLSVNCMSIIQIGADSALPLCGG